MPRAGLDKQTILAAAAEIADENGFDEVSLAKLAKNLGVRTPSLYNHIDGLSGLKNKLTVYGLNLLSDELIHAAVGQSKDDAVRALAYAYIHFARKHPGLYEATQRKFESQDEEIRNASKEVIDPVIKVFNAYGFENDHLSIHTVRSFRSLLHGFASIEQQGGFGIPVDIDMSLEVLIDIFLAGICSLVNDESYELKDLNTN